MSRPRGLAVWAGLDTFGTEVVGRLDRWLKENPDHGELAAANKLLPRVVIATSHHAGVAESGEEEDGAGSGLTVQSGPIEEEFDPAIAAVTSALGELLASPLSRDALEWADRDLLIPHVWLVADIGAPEAAELSEWLDALFRQLGHLQVEAKVFLVLLNRSWSRQAREQEEVVRRIRAIVEEVCLAGRPGEGRTMVFVISDRDRIGGRYSQGDTTSLAHRFADWILLGDMPHSDLTRAARAFVAPISDVTTWDRVPVFASFAGRTLQWDAPALSRKNEENRQGSLLAALGEPVSRTYTPSPPTMKKPGRAEGVRWPDRLGLPRWSPRFANSARSEFEASQERYHAWLSRAELWRHEMLVAHEDGQAFLKQQASDTLRQYLSDLDDSTRTVLENEKIEGFFHPVGRLLELASADLKVTLKDLHARSTVMAGAVGKSQSETSQVSIETPTLAMADADDPLVIKLGRKINAPLLYLVSGATFLLLWGWTIYASRLIDAWMPTIRAVSPPVRRAEVDSLPEQLRSGLVDRGADFLPEIQQVLPSTTQVAFGSFVGFGLLIAAIAIVIVQRQQVALERAWKQIHDRAGRWRDTAVSSLESDLREAEVRYAHTNLELALSEVEARLLRLRELEARSTRPIQSEAIDDPVIDDRIEPSVPVAPPLTPLQVAEIITAFRKGRHDDPAFKDDPDEIIQDLYREASRVVGDPQPVLQREIRHLQTRIRRAMPRAGAVRIQPPAADAENEHARSRATSFLAVPQQVAESLSSEEFVCHPIPVDDRFYAIVVESGMNARHVLGHLPDRIELPKDPAGISAGHSEAEAGQGASISTSVRESGGSGPGNIAEATALDDISDMLAAESVAAVPVVTGGTARESGE